MTVKNIFDLRIRRMLEMHWDDVLEIEHLTTFHEELLTKKFLKEMPTDLANGIVAVETNGDVLGFAITLQGPYPKQFALLRLAVHPSTQRRGIGWLMMEHIKRRAMTIDAMTNRSEIEAMEFLSEQKFTIRHELNDKQDFYWRYQRSIKENQK